MKGRGEGSPFHLTVCIFIQPIAIFTLEVIDIEMLA